MMVMLRRMMLALFLLTGLSQGVSAAQQFAGLCSFVKIEILQELALERVGFLATLEITNNEGDASITDFSAFLTFEERPTTLGEPGKDASAMFFVQPPTVSGINAVDGTGILRPGETAVVSWLIIPKTSAGGDQASGIQYNVGANLGGSLYGQPISPDVLLVIPDTITVKPEPQLAITYFQPQDVDGDDPFTLDVVETPIPFTLGVLVKNVGFGEANKLTIDSEQPRVVENQQGLLVIPQLLGSRVDDEPTDYASLKVNLGNIPPGKCRKGAWDMITTLSGEFTEFRASYTHASELGGEETSLIRSVDAYFMVHEVLNDQPGRDGLLDFLADTDPADRLLLPELLYESDCNTLPVNVLTQVTLQSYDAATLTAEVQTRAEFENWVFIRLDDPAQAKLKIASVTRSDGKVLDPHNYWTHIRYRKPDNAKLTWLNIFDFVGLDDYTYTVVYEPAGSDTVAPATVMRFNGEEQSRNGKHYIVPETQMFFTVEDDSPVSSWYALDGATTFQPAVPFKLDTPGEHRIEFYSIDASGNEESHHQEILVLTAEEPQLARFDIDSDSLFIAGDALSIRPTLVDLSFQGVLTTAGLTASVDVFRGVYAFPTLAGVPSTPTSANSAQISVAGEQVDFYRYRLNGGSWSAEFPVTDPISLTGLAGPVDLDVQGRSLHGSYPAESVFRRASWRVDPATVLSLSGVPASPTGLHAATLQVVGASHYCYRIDGGFFLPNLQANDPVVLSQLGTGVHTVEIIGNDSLSVCPANGTAEIQVSWEVDPAYGYQLPADQQVQHADLGTVDDAPSHYVWDGRDASGAVVEPGWYSLRLQLDDGLGRSSYALKTVQVGDMLADGALLSDNGGIAQQHVRSFGKWAVWADQRSGDWDIRARYLVDSVSDVIVRGAALNQERPATDGRYVVWQERQADGNWDIWIRDLETLSAAQAVTSSAGDDEINPVVDWPWVVYQRKSLSDPTAPWQLVAHNLLTGSTGAVDPTAADQLDPAIHRGRLVWQDWRDVGPGEIYLKDLRSGEVRRITNDTGGQYHPAIFDHWIVWSDNRLNHQLDLYGYNLRRGVEVQLTNTPEDENYPRVNDRWVVYEEDAGGVDKINLRLLHLGNLANVQLTNTRSVKEQPSQSAEHLVWTEVDGVTGVRQVMRGHLPGLQAVFNNRNTVAVTSGMASRLVDAFGLLRHWHDQAGVTAITHYSSLLPSPVSETAVWNAGTVSGDNFSLTAGDYLWVKFGDSHILELGSGGCSGLDLVAGVNAFSYPCFPDHYSAYELIRELGTNQVVSLRVLDAGSGQWQVANVQGGVIVGEDFRIPTLAVVMLELQAPRSGWIPGK